MPIKSDKLGPGRLTIGETGTVQEFGSQLRKCQLEPDVDTEDPIPVLSGEELAGDDTIKANLTGSVLDSYDMQSLAVWAKKNTGKELPFEFVPNESTTNAYKIIGRVKIRPIGSGGDVKTRNENDFEFPVVADWDYVPVNEGP
ncbi:hypothetical protein [Arthrobacter sp. RCC_34]|uniref:hypothetical protein n=1 Tax=Arthrobacter sp. RCC_34 TaxID=3239230 RepID=UPI003523D419